VGGYLLTICLQNNRIPCGPATGIYHENFLEKHVKRMLVNGRTYLLFFL